MVADRFKRTVGLRLELADRPHIALSAVAHSLAGHLIGHEKSALAAPEKFFAEAALSPLVFPDSKVCLPAAVIDTVN